MKKKTFVPYLLAGFLFLSSIGYMVWLGISEGSVYFLNVSEAIAAPLEENESMRLFGKVATFTKSQTNDMVEFVLEDAENATQTLIVFYKGSIPDTFDTGVEVILEGKLEEKKYFQAKSLMTQCPSKYEKENRV